MVSLTYLGVKPCVLVSSLQLWVRQPVLVGWACCPRDASVLPLVLMFIPRRNVTGMHLLLTPRLLVLSLEADQAGLPIG